MPKGRLFRYTVDLPELRRPVAVPALLLGRAVVLRGLRHPEGDGVHRLRQNLLLVALQGKVKRARVFLKQNYAITLLWVCPEASFSLGGVVPQAWGLPFGPRPFLAGLRDLLPRGILIGGRRGLTSGGVL